MLKNELPDASLYFDFLKDSFWISNETMKPRQMRARRKKASLIRKYIKSMI